MINKNILIVYLFLFTFTIGTASASISEIGALNVSSCMSFTRDIAVNPDYDYAYIYGENGANTEVIAIVDISSPTSPSISSCKTLSNYGSSTGGSITYIPSSTSGINGFLYIGGFDTAIRKINVTGSGATLTYTGFINLNARQIQTGSTFTTDDYGVAGGRADGKIYSLDLLGLTATQELDLSSFTTAIWGVSAPYNGGGSDYALVTSTNGNYLIKNLNTLIYHDTNGASTTSSDRQELKNNLFSAVGSATLYLYQYASGNITLKDSIACTSIFSPCLIQGGAFVGNSTFLAGAYNTSGDNVKLIEYNITNPANIVNVSNYSVAYPSSSIVSVEYKFPYAYVVTRSNSITNFLSIYTVTTSQTNSSNYKSPQITTYETATGSLAYKNNESVIINAVVTNTETSLFGEAKYYNLTCDYSETTETTETFDDSYNFTATCGSSFPIGTIAGHDFGLGLNLTDCINDILPVITSLDNNTIVSFDVYSPKTEGGNATIEFIDFAGNAFETFTLNYNTDGFLNIKADGQTLLHIDTEDTPYNVPTRIYFQLNPGTSDANLDNEIYVSTNYYLLKKEAAFSDDISIDGTYCNYGYSVTSVVPQYCAIGKNHSVTSAYANFYGIRIVNAVGNISMDNYQVKTLKDYPPLTSYTTDSLIQKTCNYATTGTKTARAYASDEYYGYNYLANRDLTLSITSTGVSPPTDLITNGSITSAIKDAVGVAGFANNSDLILLALMLIAGAIYGGYKATSGHLYGGALSGVVSSLIFYKLNWLPISYIVLIIIVASLGVASEYRKRMTG